MTPTAGEARGDDMKSASDDLTDKVVDFIKSIFSNSEIADFPCDEWIAHQWRNWVAVPTDTSNLSGIDGFRLKVEDIQSACVRCGYVRKPHEVGHVCQPTAKEGEG